MEYSIFVKTIMTMVLIKNDCHYMHLMSKGEDFDKSHNLTQDYFSTLDYTIDVISEMALEVQETIPNYSQALQIISGYQVENESSYDYPTVIEHLIGRISILVVSLKELRNTVTNASMQSKLDDIIRNWENELSYKLSRRRPERGININFIDTGMDKQTVAYRQSN